MPTAEQIQQAISRVADQRSFIVELLRDCLGWPIPEGAETVEDVAYEWSLDDFRAAGLDRTLSDGRILQIQPLVQQQKQPWGVFVLRFRDAEPFLKARGMTTVLRLILKDLVSRRDSMRPVFKRENLLFICTHEFRFFKFAMFRNPPDPTHMPPLATFGWNPPQAARTVCEYNLKELAWPGPAVIDDPLQWTAAWSKAFDVEKVTKRFFDDYSDVFTAVEEEFEATLPDEKQRRLFTQRLFNRLMFLRFVEQKGWLRYGDRTDYLRALCEAGGINGRSLYLSRVHTLFFEALAIPGRQTSDAVGQVKYLNGGLFERKLEDDLVPDIADEVFTRIIGPRGLFYRWNFTVEESTPLDIQVAVDPEMLGKVFEKLVTGRKDKGAYYTPRQIVSFMCKETLKGYLGGYEELVDHHIAAGITVHQARELLQRLARVKVIDPACGSGAYLVGMLHELHMLNHLLDTRVENRNPRNDYQLKLSIIQNNLYGVDIEEFAVNTACLRLWLSIAVDFDGDNPEPLPNLDFKIGVGDSLAAPLPEAFQYELFDHQLIHEMERHKAAFSRETDHANKEAIRRQIAELQNTLEEHTHSAVPAGVFNWTVAFAEVFLTDPARLGSGGFDIVIANPPYGLTVSDAIRDSYFNRRTEPGQSKDSYGIFIARGLQLMRPAGQLSYIISDTWRTIKSHLPLRRRLLQLSAVRHVLDLPPWVFDATVNTGILTLTKGRPQDGHKLIAGDLRSIADNDWRSLTENLLAVANHGFDAQTLSYARYTYPQQLIQQFSGCSFFIGSPCIRKLLAENQFVCLSVIARVKKGLATTNNRRFYFKEATGRGNYQLVDHAKVLLPEEIARLSDNEKTNGIDPGDYDGRHLVPLDKGEEADIEAHWLPNYYVPHKFYVDWSRDAVQSLYDLGGMRNPQYQFRAGICFSWTGFYAPTFRLNTGCVFDQSASCIFQDVMPVDALLGILASTTLRYILKCFCDHTVNSTASVIEQAIVRIPEGPDLEQLRHYVSSVIARQRVDATYDYWNAEQEVIEELVQKLYGLSELDVREIRLWYCRRYPALAERQGMVDEIRAKYADYLAHCEHVLSKPPKYWRSNPVLMLIAQGEGQDLEFKETLSFDINQQRPMTERHKDSLKTIAAFLNATGGTLLIGVADTGEVKGLERDFALANPNHNADSFQLKLRDLMGTRLAPAPLGHVDVSFVTLPDRIICRVDVRPSNDIVHLDDREVYVRDGNRTLRLEGRDLTDWIQRRTAQRNE